MNVLDRYRCISLLVMVDLRERIGLMKTAPARIVAQFHQRGSSQLHLGVKLLPALRPQPITSLMLLCIYFS